MAKSKKKAPLVRGPILSSPLEFNKKAPAPTEIEPEVKLVDTTEVGQVIFFARVQLSKLHPQVKTILPTEDELQQLAMLYSGKQYIAYTDKFEEIFKIKR